MSSAYRASAQGRVSGNRSIGPRSDMDALPLAPLSKFEQASKHPGRRHAHGCDGHAALPLAAACNYWLSLVPLELPLE